jgi:hypothetical protein
LVLNHDQIADVLERLCKKIGIKNTDEVTVEELIKRVVNQNLIYNDNLKEVNLFKPSFMNAFLLKNGKFNFSEGVIPEKMDVDLVTSIKMNNNKELVVRDFHGNKAVVPYDGNNVSVVFNKPIPFDVAMQLFS